jgi:outer membrane protein assembly factor BamE (lipoprotein component of BamABCDE complex)
MKTISSFLLSLILLSACATSSTSRLSKVSPGMTREEVVQTLGRPVSTSAGEDVEFLNYLLSDSRGRQACYVRLRHGKVDAAGKVGDYQSSDDPTVQIHLKPRQD